MLTISLLEEKTASPYEISSLMFKLYAKMSEFFLTKKALSFFMGGDNFMVVANSNHRESAEEFIDIIKNELGIEPKLWNRNRKNC